jgi:hypothetical protein
MGVSAQAIRAMLIPEGNPKSQFNEPAPGASTVSRAVTRSLLIETIRQNVMAWTRWTELQPFIKSDPSARDH